MSFHAQFVFQNLEGMSYFVGTTDTKAKLVEISFRRYGPLFISCIFCRSNFQFTSVAIKFRFGMSIRLVY